MLFTHYCYSLSKMISEVLIYFIYEVLIATSRKHIHEITMVITVDSEFSPFLNKYPSLIFARHSTFIC